MDSLERGTTPRCGIFACRDSLCARFLLCEAAWVIFIRRDLPKKFIIKDAGPNGTTGTGGWGEGEEACGSNLYLRVSEDERVEQVLRQVVLVVDAGLRGINGEGKRSNRAIVGKSDVIVFSDA